MSVSIRCVIPSLQSCAGRCSTTLLYSDRGGAECPPRPEYKGIPLYTSSSVKGNLPKILSAWSHGRLEKILRCNGRLSATAN